MTIFFHFRSLHLKTASNLLLINLSVSGLLMILPFPISTTNILYRGPYLGALGAKVLHSRLKVFENDIIYLNFIDLWVFLDSFWINSDLEFDPDNIRKSLCSDSHQFQQTSQGTGCPKKNTPKI